MILYFKIVQDNIGLGCILQLQRKKKQLFNVNKKIEG